MRKIFLPALFLLLFIAGHTISAQSIIDHTCTDITKIPEAAIDSAKSKLHIAYGHTSHGSQLTNGMSGLVAFANGGGLGLSLSTDIFAYNNGGTSGALDLHDYAMGGDCGYHPAWVNNTRTYLDNAANSDVNVIIWSWCGQVSSRDSLSMISTYLAPMTQLELDYPDVTFVYMTGHANGYGEAGNVHIRNQQIRQYCIDNDKTLFDFYDIECYDPDNNYFGDKMVTDNCDYDSSGNGVRDANWATKWQNTHTEDADWYSCSSAHSKPLNANRKAYASWYLWAIIAGWDGDATSSIITNEEEFSYQLSQNYPNPFNPSTTISFSVKKAGQASFRVFNTLGQAVFSNQINANIGQNSVKFDASNLSSGVYFYQIQQGNMSMTKKMLLMK